MLEKLTTHDVQDIFEPFSLADKCARAADGRVWHSQHAPKAGKAGKPKADAAAQSSDKKTGRRRRLMATTTSRWPELPLLLLQ
jgi:hypothetical protein